MTSTSSFSAFRNFSLGVGLAGLALAVLASPVEAHGPTRQKVTLSTEVAATPDKVWAVVGNFQDMSWHPAVHSSTGTGDNAPGATRVLTLGEEGGPTISEELYKYDAAKMTYSYRITDVKVEVLPVTNYSSHLTVKPVGSDRSLIEWRGAFYRGYPNNDPPANLNDEAAVAAVSGVYQGGLDALKARFGD
ncbi:SRPBCC family protein [Roseibium aestuarii]|uniref:SRPBCC family protein n=1 Tax=Roseibium aestuarii TaxID=2600299 RepID=A0ABW4JX58_9HYPH|nr:SRPBCC family protein [Roseibium aestuarii]